ncbi:hypothetical protein GCM10010168_93530 [Actinoplanes ianthinogenes]|uniref:Uncharacterized protein n=1 Tax=Actinoplanes ianthinogenes TaxID=122358 RepID=A0ABM7LKJ8_9ACTN|nr:hypothetical protein [Actinoplanes ianthinogenes]BCJ39774.1 hypothetical protein Aiant_04310 [Actinoplanes ianthinogenes]GGR60015.1 hypothetical protein GCM10010168_93530 [Actinoplanes ianthinogenes]
MRKLWIVVAALSLAACGAPAPVGTAAGPRPDPSAPVLPAGWRWESYGGVEVGVPGEWGWGDRGLRLDAWCIDGPGGKPPVVARPGAGVPLIACMGAATDLAHTGTVVGFGDAASETDGITRDGDRVTVTLGKVEVIVQTPAELRERILATIHKVTVDAYGCPATHSLKTRPTDVTKLHDVTAVSVCRYRLSENDPTLLSSLRLTDDAADRAIRGIAQAPVGGGPNRPQDCAPEVAHGDEAIVLAIGSAEVLIRYAGCVDIGYHDGTAVRRVDRDSLSPFLAGPNATLAFVG